MRAFGAGMPVITTDVPQFREFDAAFCWRVPIDPDGEKAELERLMRDVSDDLGAARARGDSARRFVEAEATVSAVADRYEEIVCEILRLKKPKHTSGGDRSSPAVNAIGYWAAATGVGEAARRVVLALDKSGVAVTLDEFPIDVPTAANRVPREIAQLPRGRSASVSICFLNINEMHGVRDEFLRPVSDDYVIAYWYWEVPGLPDHLASEVRRFDEIWVASRFVQANLTPYTTAPIHVMPAIVEPEPNSLMKRSDFNLPEGKCTFLFSFDVGSGIARKNPFAVIDAFEGAFSNVERRDDVCLAMKTSNLARHPEAQFELRRRLDSVGGKVIDESLTPGVLDSLMALCDAYVSLHRAEGFGLGIAEAMALGVPTIVTRYSGCDDFVTSNNCCGVGYSMVPIDLTELRFNPGAELLYRGDMLWAEPDVEQASRWMRFLADHPQDRRRIGAAGATTIRERYSQRRAGSAMRSRLLEIIENRRNAGSGYAA